MRRLRIPLAVLVVAAGAGLALSGRRAGPRLPMARPIEVTAAYRESTDTLKSGETLGDLLDRHMLAGFDLVRVVEQAGVDARRLRAGLVVQFRQLVGEELPSRVTMRVSPDERLAARRADAGWSVERRAVGWTTEVVRIEGPIDNSLYEALDARIPDDLLDADNRVRLAWDLADVYAWSVDFTRDIQPGDRFAVLVEREHSEEGEVRTGAVLAADLLVSGRHLSAFRFASGTGAARYFDGEGRSLRRAFLRAPLEFRRIASTFSRSRFHPILGIWRRHEGTDYAASSGTPVLAAGDGTVLRAEWSGGYGNLVEIRHRNGITTRYGHLRAFARGVRAGVRVVQGQTVGYVGATGLASGPHLHYEFRINGVARDSRRIDLGAGAPLPRALLPAFQEERARLATALGGSQ